MTEMLLKPIRAKMLTCGDVEIDGNERRNVLALVKVIEEGR